MEKVYISYDRDCYQPGDWVSGTVSVHLNKDIRARAVKIGWSGQSGHHGLGTRGGGKGDCQFLFRGANYPWKAEEGWNKIPAGKHTFPFLFLLPTDLPPSQFRHRAGYVSYSVYVKIARPWNFDYRGNKSFIVVSSTQQPSTPNDLADPPTYSASDRAPPPNYQE